jgi:hypothetical protein
VTTAWRSGFAAQATLLMLLGQVERVTTRVAALEGFQTVLHHTAMVWPSIVGSCGGTETFPQQ